MEKCDEVIATNSPPLTASNSTFHVALEHEPQLTAVVATADRTAYDVLYSYRSLPGIAVVSVSIYLLQFQI